MTYQILIRKHAKKFIDALPKNEKRRIVEALRRLPDQGDIKRLQGYGDLFRLRVGSYRIIYSVDGEKLLIIVIDAGSRGQIYNRY